MVPKSLSKKADSQLIGSTPYQSILLRVSHETETIGIVDGSPLVDYCNRTCVHALLIKKFI